MTKGKFAVGERVRVYSAASVSEVAEVYKVLGETGLEVVLTNGAHSFVHPKQVRRLRKREKPGRVERWLNIYCDHQARDTFFTEGSAKEIISKCANYRGTVHLVELREGEKIISREELATAFGNTMALYLPKELKADNEKVLLNCFLDHFGLVPHD